MEDSIKHGFLLYPAGIWTILLVPLAMLLIVIQFEWRGIERDLKGRANNELAAHDITWAQAETFNRGRNILLTGQPTKQSEIDRAMMLLQSIKGIESVSLSQQVAVPNTLANLELKLSDQVIALTGVLASQTQIQETLALVRQFFPKQTITTELLSGDQIADLPDLTGLFNALADHVDEEDRVVVHLSGTELVITGQVGNASTVSSLEAELKPQFNGKLGSELAVVVKKDVCQELINTLLTQDKIRFNSGSANINASSFDLLQRLTDTASQCPAAHFEIVGHTDSRGNLEANISLSKQRAKAVADYLVKQGLNSQRFSATGVGPNEPSSDNTSEVGRAQNRRIELRLVN